ncbi:MAG: helix-hairpin-helix domain-containing protein [Candidatus Azobacteroides sp.]|nr:helix-hairpin-helix domain-containing protein [Candidatus Azobacteroides sp.]
MWKDFFSFTKKERQGIFILIALMSGICIGKFFFSREKQLSDKEDIIIEHTTEKRKNEVENSSGESSSDYQTNKPAYILKPFDPNSADSSTFVSFGLKPYIAKNIIRYRNKGGKFKSADDFAKVYGLTSGDFNRLKPYIQIKSEMQSIQIQQTSKDTATKVSFSPKENIPASQKQEKIALGTIIDINSADTAELKKIPFIGSSYAQRIVKYREILGGFYTIEQLKEVYGFDGDLFLKVSPYVGIAENPHIQAISVNQSSLDRLKAHPYINFYQAKVIIELRKKKGKISNFSELAMFEEFTEKDLERLKFYLSFE